MVGRAGERLVRAGPAACRARSRAPGAWPRAAMRYRATVAKEKSSQASEAKQPITVLFDRVLVQVVHGDGERRSRAGILIPATAEVSRRLSWGEAVAVGPHVRAVKPGDKVLFNPEDRFEVEVQGEEYVILRERDIHAMASERIDGGTGLYL